MQIFKGTNNFTQKAYILAEYFQEHTPGISYWVQEDDHFAKAGAEAYAFFSTNPVYLIDQNRDGYPYALGAAISHKPGVYCCSVETFQDIDRLLSLASQYKYLLKHAQVLAPLELADRLVKLGFDRDGEGSFSYLLVGGTMTLFLENDSYQIVFDEVGVESITNRTTKKGQSTLELFPLTFPEDELPEEDITLPSFSVIID